MENPFKQILYDEKLPDMIKGRVTDNIALIKLSLEIAELFAIELPNIMTDFIKEEQKFNRD